MSLTLSCLTSSPQDYIHGVGSYLCGLAIYSLLNRIPYSVKLCVNMYICCLVEMLFVLDGGKDKDNPRDFYKSFIALKDFKIVSFIN